MEIICLVEQSHLPVRRTLKTLGILPSRFHRWYVRYRIGGPEALEDQSSKPGRVWNKIPDAICDDFVQLALDEPDLSPRELSTRFTDTKEYFVSESSVFRLLKAHDLIASPALIVMKVADEFILFLLRSVADVSISNRTRGGAPDAYGDRRIYATLSARRGPQAQI